MMSAIGYGALSGLAILIGAIFGLYLKPSSQWIAAAMAFGSGVLFSALSIDLMNNAFDQSQSPLNIGIGFLAGALVFIVGDYLIDLKGGYFRRHTKGMQAIKNNSLPDNFNSGTAIFFGTILDGIPESLVLGAALSSSGNMGLVFVVALCLSNLPEGMSGTIGMKLSGMTNRSIWILWIGTFIITALAVIIGYVYLGEMSTVFKASAMAFASGAMLAMLCSTMIPEAFKYGGRFVALLCVSGFLLAFLLSKMG